MAGEPWTDRPTRRRQCLVVTSFLILISRAAARLLGRQFFDRAPYLVFDLFSAPLLPTPYLLVHPVFQ